MCTKTGCKRDITKDGARCRLKDVLAQNCPHKDKHRYKSKVQNPYTGKQDKITTHQTNDPAEAVKLHFEFIEELKATKYGKIESEPLTEQKITLLFDNFKKFEDFLNNEGLEEYESTKRTTGLVKDHVRHLLWLGLTLKKKYKPSNLFIDSIGKEQLDYIYNQLKNRKKKDGSNPSASSFNAHIRTYRFFFNWLINTEKHDLENPFQKIKLQKETSKIIIIEDYEFDLFISGIEDDESKWMDIGGTKRNMYRSDWPLIFTGLVATGYRRSDFFNLKGENIQDNMLMLSTSKVEHKHPIPIRGLLAKVIDATEYWKREPSQYLFASEDKNRTTIADKATRAFNHWWAKTGIKKEATLHDLRKTFVTKAMIANGTKGSEITHKNEETAIRHYFSSIESAKNMKESVYDYKCLDKVFG